jgi:hypothetical protein
MSALLCSLIVPRGAAAAACGGGRRVATRRLAIRSRFSALSVSDGDLCSVGPVEESDTAIGRGMARFRARPWRGWSSGPPQASVEFSNVGPLWNVFVAVGFTEGDLFKWPSMYVFSEEKNSFHLPKL